MILRRSAGTTGLLLLSLALAASLTRADEPAAAADLSARAVELYDAGRYAESRELLERLDELGALDGPLLYRLHYTQRAANDPGARATLERARERLEAETAEATGLEAPFYLANAYANLAQPADARRVAVETTARVEAGTIPEPRDGVGMFWLAKLYADHDKDFQAELWYRRSLDSFAEADDASSAAYGRWARRWLADRAWETGDWQGAAETYARLAEREPSRELFERLARAYARLGQWGPASAAWNRVVLIDPANANDARYGMHLVRAAGQLDLPPTAPDGRAWSEISKQDLEQLLLDGAGEVRAVRAELGDAPPTPAERARLQPRLDAARPTFVAAGLEYALRGLPIREAAFFGGYSPLIFKDKEWQLPRARPIRADRPAPPGSGS